MLFLSRLHFSLTPAWQLDRKYFIRVAPLLLCLSIQRQQVCVVKGEGWGGERRLKVWICWAWLFWLGVFFAIFAIFLVPLHGRRRRWDGNPRQIPSLAVCIGNWCLWAKREDEVGGLLLTWQEADIWKSHLCQRRVWPVVRCLSVLELLNQSWPRIVEGGPNYPPSPVPFQKMFSWMLKKAWHKYKHFNSLSSLLCTFESSRPCCNMSNNELLVAKWCSLLNCNASGFFSPYILKYRYNVRRRDEAQESFYPSSAWNSSWNQISCPLSEESEGSSGMDVPLPSPTCQKQF